MKKAVLESFDDIYKKTYDKVLKYTIIKCSNVEDANDIVQETYIEFYKCLLSEKDIDKIEAYLFGILNNKIKKHYGLLKRISTLSLFTKIEKDFELISTIEDSDKVEELVFDKLESETVWNFLKHKGTKTMKIFSLYYQLGCTIKEISSFLNLTESNVKNILYRTKRELKLYLEERR